MAGKRTRNTAETVFTGKDELTRVVGPLRKNLVALAKGFLPVAVGIGTVVGASAAFRAGLDAQNRVVKQAIDLTAREAVEVKNLSRALGLGTEFLQGLAFAADKADVKSEALNLAIQRMTRRIGEAARGGGEAAKEIERLGFNAKELADLRAEEQFFRVADAIAGVRGQSEKLATAFKFFDSEGARPVLALLERYPGELREQIDLAKELGAVYDDELIRKSEDYRAAQVELQAAIKGTRAEIADVFLPLARKAVESARDFLADNQDRIRALAEKFAGDLEGSFNRLREKLADKETGRQIKEILDAWAKISTPVLKFILEAPKWLVDFLGSDTGKLLVAGFTQNVGAPGTAFAQGVGPGGAQRPLLQPPLPGMESGTPGLTAQQLQAYVKRLLEQERAARRAASEAAGRELAGMGPLTDFPGGTLFSNQDLPFFTSPASDMGPDGAPAAPGLPAPEAMDANLERWGLLSKAVEDFGIKAVDSTLKIEDALDAVGDRSKEIFVHEFAANLAAMGRSLSLSFVQNFGNLKNFTAQAGQAWESFKDQVLAALIRMIAKMAIAATLSAFLGFGNFKAIGKIGQLLGIEGLGGEGQRFGGVIGRGGRFGIVPGESSRLLGDRHLVPLEAGEAVLTRREVSRIGRSGIAGLNAGLGSPIGMAEDDTLLAGGRVAVVQAQIWTLAASRSEIMESARVLYDAMVDGGMMQRGAA